MRAWQVHYLNKYPGGSVNFSENSVDAYNKDGEHMVAIRKDGGGSWVCVSKAEGCLDVHDLSPLPKEARLKKLCKKSGFVIDDELAKERRSKQSALVAEGRIGSVEELSAKGFKFDKEGNFVSAPAASTASAPAQL